MFSSLSDELDCWASAGLQARLWFRDDDATQPSEALVRLAELADRFAVPMLLAVVPKPATRQLGQFIANNPLLDAAVHGYRHRSHAAAGQKSIELGGAHPVAAVCRELSWSLGRLQELCGPSAGDILVPPWNRIAPDVVQQLPELGFGALSTFGAANEAGNVEGLVQLNTHLDIIDWKASRGGRDPEWLVRELVKLLAQARDAENAPVGVLAHHLVHDATAWNFLEGLFDATTGHPGAIWCRASQLTQNGAILSA